RGVVVDLDWWRLPAAAAVNRPGQVDVAAVEAAAGFGLVVEDQVEVLGGVWAGDRLRERVGPEARAERQVAVDPGCFMLGDRDDGAKGLALVKGLLHADFPWRD